MCEEVDRGAPGSYSLLGNRVSPPPDLPSSPGRGAAGLRLAVGPVLQVPGHGQGGRDDRDLREGQGEGREGEQAELRQGTLPAS